MNNKIPDKASNFIPGESIQDMCSFRVKVVK